jgi:hypothetical protein
MSTKENEKKTGEEEEKKKTGGDSETPVSTLKRASSHGDLPIERTAHASGFVLMRKRVGEIVYPITSPIESARDLLHHRLRRFANANKGGSSMNGRANNDSSAVFLRFLRDALLDEQSRAKLDKAVFNNWKRKVSREIQMNYDSLKEDLTKEVAKHYTNYAASSGEVSDFNAILVEFLLSFYYNTGAVTEMMVEYRPRMLRSFLLGYEDLLEMLRKTKLDEIGSKMAAPPKGRYFNVQSIGQFVRDECRNMARAVSEMIHIRITFDMFLSKLCYVIKHGSPIELPAPMVNEYISYINFRTPKMLSIVMARNGTNMMDTKVYSYDHDQRLRNTFKEALDTLLNSDDIFRADASTYTKMYAVHLTKDESETSRVCTVVTRNKPTKSRVAVVEHGTYDDQITFHRCHHYNNLDMLSELSQPLTDDTLPELAYALRDHKYTTSSMGLQLMHDLKRAKIQGYATAVAAKTGDEFEKKLIPEQFDTEINDPDVFQFFESEGEDLMLAMAASKVHYVFTEDTANGLFNTTPALWFEFPSSDKEAATRVASDDYGSSYLTRTVEGRLAMLDELDRSAGKEPPYVAELLQLANTKIPTYGFMLTSATSLGNLDWWFRGDDKGTEITINLKNIPYRTASGYVAHKDDKNATVTLNNIIGAYDNSPTLVGLEIGAREHLSRQISLIHTLLYQFQVIKKEDNLDQSSVRICRIGQAGQMAAIEKKDGLSEAAISVILGVVEGMFRNPVYRDILFIALQRSGHAFARPNITKHYKAYGKVVLSIVKQTTAMIVDKRVAKKTDAAFNEIVDIIAGNEQRMAYLNRAIVDMIFSDRSSS